MPVLVFDMDGTLTPPKQPIDPEMVKAISWLADRHAVWIASGASRTECEQQLGELVSIVDRVYCCSANEAWSGDRILYSNTMYESAEFVEFLEGFAVTKRSGMRSISFEGYEDIDLARDNFIAEVVERFPYLKAHKGGRYSVDVLQRDSGKHTLIEDTTRPIWYWGDECYPGGNDSSIAERLEIGAGNRVFRVANWQDTLHQLKEIFDV